MLEYTKAGDGARLSMIVLHAKTRVCFYGPAQGLPNTKVGTFTQALYDEAKKDGWLVISMEKKTGSAFSPSRTNGFFPSSTRGSATNLRSPHLWRQFTSSRLVEANIFLQKQASSGVPSIVVAPGD
jgi:hypothetical protein